MLNLTNTTSTGLQPFSNPEQEALPSVQATKQAIEITSVANASLSNRSAVENPSSEEDNFKKTLSGAFDDIFSHICEFLSPEDLIAFSQTASTYYQNGDYVRRAFKQKYQQEIQICEKRLEQELLKNQNEQQNDLLPTDSQYVAKLERMIGLKFLTLSIPKSSQVNKILSEAKDPMALLMLAQVKASTDGSQAVNLCKKALTSLYKDRSFPLDSIDQGLLLSILSPILLSLNEDHFFSLIPKVREFVPSLDSDRQSQANTLLSNIEQLLDIKKQGSLTTQNKEKIEACIDELSNLNAYPDALCFICRNIKFFDDQERSLLLEKGLKKYLNDIKDHPFFFYLHPNLFNQIDPSHHVWLSSQLRKHISSINFPLLFLCRLATQAAPYDADLASFLCLKAEDSLRRLQSQVTLPDAYRALISSIISINSSIIKGNYKEALRIFSSISPEDLRAAPDLFDHAEILIHLYHPLLQLIQKAPEGFIQKYHRTLYSFLNKFFAETPSQYLPLLIAFTDKYTSQLENVFEVQRV